MNVQDIMERNFVTVPEDATYKEVADVLYEQNQHCVFVIDERGELVGFVSEHDLFRVLYPFYGSYYLNAEMYTDHTQREKKIEAQVLRSRDLAGGGFLLECFFVGHARLDGSPSLVR